MKNIVIIAIVLFSASLGYAQKFDQLAMTPPMGWNSWNGFGCNVDEKLIRETADSLVTSGMKGAGYQYVVIDDCWQGVRDANGFIQPNAQRFPSGMKALGDYIHAKGLKFGIYSDVGNKTCGGFPGSRGHEYQDAFTYASWGVDYLKYDWCDAAGLNAVGSYTTIRDAIYAAKRPIVLSICEWGENRPWEWAKTVGHLWRTTGDITSCWDCEENHGSWSKWGILRILDKQKPLRVHAGPGHWNDPDMLEVGNGMTVSEDRAHFSLWAMLAAPLIAGNDVRKMSADTREIFTNKDVVAIGQDALGLPAYPALAEDGLEIWVKPLANEAFAVCFLNRTGAVKIVEFNWKDKYIKDDS
ncbi:MAG: glycoside hydrolase family 27 protein, partial [Acidobacteriota bacterium]